MTNATPPPDKPPALESFSSAAPKASWIFGSVLLVFLMAAVFIDIDPSKLPIIRFFMALAAAFFALFFVGGVLLKGTLNGLFISATGGFVLFILMQFVFNPFAPSNGPVTHPTPTPTSSPTPTPPDSISTNLPAGLTLRRAIQFIASLDGGTVDFKEGCSRVDWEVEVREGPITARSPVELIKVLRLRVKSPAPQPNYQVTRNHAGGTYEITCD